MAFHPYPQVIRALCNGHRCGPPRPVTDASACPWVAHVVSGLPGATRRALHTRFRCGSPYHWVNQPHRVTRRIMLQKARRQADPTGILALRLHGSQRFQDLFHSPRRGTFHRSLTVLCTIGHVVYGALGRGRPRFTPGCTCRVLLKYTHARIVWMSPTGLSPPLVPCSNTLRFPNRPRGTGMQPVHVRTCNPRNATPARLARSWFRLAPGSLATTTGVILVPPGTEMFQFPRCPPSSGRCESQRLAGCPIRTW